MNKKLAYYVKGAEYVINLPAGYTDAWPLSNSIVIVGAEKKPLVLDKIAKVWVDLHPEPVGEKSLTVGKSLHRTIFNREKQKIEFTKFHNPHKFNSSIDD